MFIKLVMTAVCLTGGAYASLAGHIHPFHDAVSGEWDITLKVAGGQATGTMNLKVDGKKLTGTIESAHTGPGVVTEGTWEDGKLSCVLTFEKHESIKFWGTAKEGHLEGEFQTEGNTGKWIATKRVGSSATTSAVQATSPNATVANGVWEATLAANGTTAPVTLEMVTDGSKVSGTFTSEHMGTGPIVNGWIKDGKIGFVLKMAKASIDMNGSIAGKSISGEFGSGAMKGTWTAVKKG